MTNPPTILLAEDDDNHVLLIKRSFVHARLMNPVHVACDGRQAVAYLAGEGKFADRAQYPVPGILLLDLKMPNVDGFEVIQWARGRAEFAALPIVVLTTSDRIFDVKRAFLLGANGFLTKPLRLGDFIQLGPVIKGFWTWTVGTEEASPPPEIRLPTESALPNGRLQIPPLLTNQNGPATVSIAPGQS